MQSGIRCTVIAGKVKLENQKNNMVILMVGPSCGGKTTLAVEYCATNPNSIRVEMDKLINDQFPEASAAIHRGITASPYFEATVKLLNSFAESDNEIRLVDIGAGSIVDPRAVSLFQSGQHKVITISPGPQVAYERARAHRPQWRHKTLEQYMEVEFSENRQAIYQSALVTIDTSKDLATCTGQLSHTIAELNQKEQS